MKRIGSNEKNKRSRLFTTIGWPVKIPRLDLGASSGSQVLGLKTKIRGWIGAKADVRP